MGTHVWNVNESERCLFCGVNIYDNDIYGPYACVERKPLIWTSETEKKSSEPSIV